jgi:hypothetical protein
MTTNPDTRWHERLEDYLKKTFPVRRRHVRFDHTEIDRLTAALEVAKAGLERVATYLDALGDNLSGNDVDMMLDPCADPQVIAQDLRATALAAVNAALGGK